MGPSGGGTRAVIVGQPMEEEKKNKRMAISKEKSRHIKIYPKTTRENAEGYYPQGEKGNSTEKGCQKGGKPPIK